MQEQALHSTPSPSRVASLRSSASSLKSSAVPSTRHFLKEHGHWIVLLIPLLALAYGPVAWTSGAWFFPNSPLIFQPFIPILAGALAWSRRRELTELYRRLARRVDLNDGSSAAASGQPDNYDYYGGSRRRRTLLQRMGIGGGSRFAATNNPTRGTIWLAVAGCVLTLITYMTQTPGIAILGLILILVGAINYVYGRAILAALTIPLLFLLFMIPPPEALLSYLNPTAQVATASVVGDLLQGAGITPTMRGPVLLLPNYRLEIPLMLSGFGVVVPVMALTLWWILYKRARFNIALVLLAIAMVVSIVLHILRFFLAGVVASSMGNTGIADALTYANSFFLIVPALVILYFIGRAMGVGSARRVAADWYGAYDASGQFGQSGASAIADAQRQEAIAEVEAGRPAARTRAIHRTRQIAGMIAACCLFAVFVNYRMGRAGEWIPAPPESVDNGIWTAIDAPLAESTLKGLGDPKAEGRLYNNPFGEQVNVTVIAGDSFEAYHEPTVCTAAFGFFLKAERKFDMEGPRTPIRAMMMHNDNQDLRIIMYYWMQHRNGTTDIDRRMGNYRDIVARFKTGLNAALFGRQTVLVRVFAVVPPNDTNGAQTNRNVREIAHALYDTLKENGTGASSPKKPSQVSEGAAGKNGA